MTRFLRSWMFVPGNRQRFLDKAYGLDADAVFLDLEDGVLPAEKPAARQLVAQYLQRPPGGPLRFLRINAVGSSWFDEDVKTVLRPGIQGVCIPKVESAGAVLAMEALVEDLERREGLPAGEIRFVVAIETALGLMRAPEIAAASPRVLALMFGAEDFALDLGLSTQREREGRELIYARSALVVAAKSAHVLAIDGVFADLDDDEGFEQDTLQARRLGFDGKSLFHPKQIERINAVFSPSEAEIQYARRVVGAYEEAVARGDGSVALGGQLVDLPIVRRAQRILDLATPS